MLTAHEANQPVTQYFAEISTSAPVVYCPVCGEVLDLHQPDASEPARLIGFCEPPPGGDGCSGMFYIEGAGGPAPVIMALPLLRGGADSLSPSPSNGECPTGAIGRDLVLSQATD
jgi:hypothetical protein